MSVNMLSLPSLTFRRSLPVILQSEVAECGLACLAMIGRFFGHKINLPSLRKEYPQSLHGVSAKYVMDIAGGLELSSRVVKLELNDISHLHTPCILHWDLNHFVVLKSSSAKSVIIHDPATGVRKLSYAEVSRSFTGIAIELQPTREFKRQVSAENISLSQVIGSIVGIRRNVSLLMALSVLLLIFTMTTPFYLQVVLDDVVVSHDNNLLGLVTVAFGFFLLFKSVTTVIRSKLVLYIGSLINQQLAANIFRHLIRLPLDYFERRHIGDLVSRFGSLDKIRQFLTQTMVIGIIDGILALIAIVVMFLYSPILASITLCAVVIYALIRLALTPVAKRLTEECIASDSKEKTNFMETIRGIQSIKLHLGENERARLWQNRYVDRLNGEIRLENFNIFYSTFNNALFGVEDILIIFLGASFVLSNQLSVGMLVAFISYAKQFSNSISSLVEKVVEFLMLNLHLERLSDIVLSEKEKTEATSSMATRDIQGQIKVTDVSYAYVPGGRPIIKNVSFEIERGESVAIIGPSGCGKTTLLKLMLGLKKPTGGEIFVDGTNIGSQGFASTYRGQVSAVMQDDTLLSGSVLDNIAFFGEKVDLDLVYECAKIAAIHDDIMEFPLGYRTSMGDMGNMLSGGQKQRILLARALYRKPNILFLDEATSSLDTKLEGSINDAVRNLNITRVIIAHRPDTIKSCDRIIDLSTF